MTRKNNLANFILIISLQLKFILKMKNIRMTTAVGSTVLLVRMPTIEWHK